MALRAQVKILPPYPPGIGTSYPGLNFAKWGVCRWNYAQGSGPVHWINWLTNVFEAEYDDPVSFDYWFQNNVVFQVSVAPYIPSALSNMKVNGTVVNVLTGKGFPVNIQ